MLTLRLLKSSHVLSMLVRETLQESVHTKAVRHSSLLLVSRRRTKELFVCVKQTRKASNKCRPDLFRVECDWTTDTYLWRAAMVSGHFAAITSVHGLVGPFVAN
jgi:hypothetical protein